MTKPSYLLRLLCLMMLGFSSQTLAAASAPSSSNLERFIDGVMQRAVATGATAGATVSVVQDGRLIVARGYGQADVAQNIPVESRVTQFRIGSISKVLVWMSVLQLVEAGKLDLDADVNRYLVDFKVDGRFSDPITLRHLMTHTPGFEDNLQDLFVSGPRQVGVLSETLGRMLPERVRLPGSTAAYSNYGAALAAHIVELVSSMTWNEYVESHIFKPLNMRGATTRQPVPEDIEATRSKGYLVDSDRLIEQPFVYVALAPAGSGTATALDMAKLMVELLNPRGTSVLSEDSKAQLINGAYIHDPKVNGITLGMYEMSQGETRAVGHGGNTILFNSLMALWPDEKMGVFVSTNTLSGENVAQELFQSLSAYLGFSSYAEELSPVENGAVYVGEYISARRNYSGLSKLVGLAGIVRVAYDAQAKSLLVTDASGVSSYQMVSQHIFQQIRGNNRIGFKVIDGRVTELFSADTPIVIYQPAKAAETPTFAILLFGCWALLAMGVLTIWPFSWLTHRRDVNSEGSMLVNLSIIGSIGLLVYFILQVSDIASGQLALLIGGFAEISDLLWYPVAFAALTLVQILYFYPVWMSGKWWLSRRLHYTVYMLVSCVVIWWLWFWNIFPAPIVDFFR